ncbi:MAG: papain fold toxin domain-containing protein [Leptolyngbya sp. IPPAS B-1204]|uniref:Tox-PL-2 domain-containing protein n=1 Tax=Leptolyngbya sp. NK1-12 TaxID=2547451 RepID=A0AA96WEF9_9CYAN|nr:MAG: hypothetical protein EDM05_06075 [Leptolyngbya sp. IPPAS B-1204]WNZ24697.1 hypothetical protein HJG54_18825 [Leptolyngbya sp. NK1-12]
MSQRSEAEVWHELGAIMAGFSVLECDKCVLAATQWLASQGIEFKILQLKTKRRSELFIASDRYSPSESITENGTHYGVEVFGRVFDNLSAEGLTREEWLQDFHCPSQQFILTELDSL